MSYTFLQSLYHLSLSLISPLFHKCEKMVPREAGNWTRVIQWLGSKLQIDDQTRALLTSLSIQPFPFPTISASGLSYSFFSALQEQKVDPTCPSSQAVNLETKTKLIFQAQQMDLGIAQWYLRPGTSLFSSLNPKLINLLPRKGGEVIY